MELKNTAVLVTGGASGLGEATAVHLAAQGAKVAVLDIQDDKAAAVAQRIGGIALHCDVTDPTSAETAIAQAREAHGVARILVNCAGGAVGKRVVGKNGPMALEDFTKVINLNLFGSFNMTRLAAAEMIAADPLGEERGLILFTTSVAAYEGQIGQASYSAAKGALASLTIQLAREFSQFGVRVMAIAPGIFLTPLLYTAPPEVQESLASSIPFPQRLGKPEEFADLVGHIATNPYLNGEVIRLDGAVRLAPR
ncbi:SDR family NAD(P)-dependent oxidoreductase [Eoetvoesiella caeni]|uniref:NAD(P)-dependent dehydrogenase (Short-subunit alcohol dehydrogenase family) n=1 Tax=Eoetvoesiella caeni TaxID=645616 RepID=A0A366HAY9_9BURK|nr:SDR family NAD(P)-dependent oxidoreductase [Eoetvoesiella caeni]MCI2809203.1 SDR family NAD(P)-dependent oxidoreductase [Eoetvoesiella caeni]NYT54345.1 SDR family NAD(P)-dependent oxidoreductase [Eoetvoesiella caeni]RBP39469.1 NAD(P)-dependent dehydrogenase (short-subunit alcohol dehydrogenase family) [Eoetvoesiella caeni]